MIQVTFLNYDKPLSDVDDMIQEFINKNLAEMIRSAIDFTEDTDDDSFLLVFFQADNR